LKIWGGDKLRENKLLVILTLCIFIITIFPTLVFGASFGASKMTAYNTKVEADGEERARFRVQVKDSDNNEVLGATIYAASSRDCDIFYEKDSDEQKESCVPGGYYYSFTDEDNDGKIEFEVSSILGGEAKIAAGFNDKVFKYLTRDDVSSGEAKIIDTKTVNFQTTEIAIIELIEIEGDNGDYTIDGPDGTPGDYEYKTVKSDAYVKANDSDYYELTFRVTNAGGNPISGVEVDFSMNQISTRIDYDTNVTDEDGEVKVRVYSSEAFYRGKSTASEFELKAEADKKKANVMLNFDPISPEEIYVSMASKLNMFVAKEQVDKEISFYIRDKDENKIVYSSLDELKEDLEMEIIEKPADSEMEEYEDFQLKPSSMKKNVTLKIPSFDEEGNYVVKLKLKHNNNEDAEKVFSFVVKEQGDITELKLEYEESIIALDSTTDVPTITRVDAEGFEYELTEDDIKNDIIFGASPIDKVASISNTGEITLVDEDDEKDYTGELLITAVDRKENLTATWLMKAQKKPRGIKLVPPTIAVPNEVAYVSIQLVDENENVVALGQDLKKRYPKVTNFIVLEKPEGANVSTDDGSMFYTKLREEGMANLEVGCDKEGNVKLMVLLDVKYNDGTLYTFAKDVVITFSEKKACFNDEVKMLIGIPAYYVDGEMKIMDAAPFIEDGRTYVPLRCVAEVFDAEIDWKQETQTITLDNGERTVSMKIGSSLIQSNNSPTIMCDGAPQIVEGRTYVPFRVIGGIFGAYVEPITDDNNNVTGVEIRMEEEE